jgi:hypothetical protein
MSEEIKIGQKLEFPDGDIATIIKINEYKDEEDDGGIYDAIELIFTIDGDKEKQEFNEMLDSRDGYKLPVMKLVTPQRIENINR